MAKSNAERQAEYRNRHFAVEGRGERLNMLMDLHAKRALERLATCYGVTQKELLESLLLRTERLALESARGQEANYYEGHLRLAFVTQ